MNVIRQCRTWIDQLLHNLSEADWASRHLTDSTDSASGETASQASSLSMALGVMGIVRRNADERIAMPGA